MTKRLMNGRSASGVGEDEYEVLVLDLLDLPPLQDAPSVRFPGEPASEARMSSAVGEVQRVTRRSTVGAPAGTPVPNLLLEGDAVAAMNALMSVEATRTKYAGNVNLCYIDPPFNTGERFGQYDDSMHRHLWLRMMREALTAAKGFLSPDGSIWLHLGDSTQHHGRLLLDEVFGPGAFVATIIWQKRTSRDNRKAFSSMHDYIHVYAPTGPKHWKTRRNALPDSGTFANPDNDPRGPWRSTPMTAQAGHATAAQFYTVVTPAGSTHVPPPGRCWTYTKERLGELDADGRIYWPRNGHGKPRLKRYQTEVDGVAPFTIWTADEVGDNSSAKKDLLSMFGDRPGFDTPKPEQLLQRIISIATRPGELVMDCFLGSGTTAVVAQKMQRQWLGIEQSRRTLETCTIPRLRSVLAGVDGIGIPPDASSERPGFEVAELTP